MFSTNLGKALALPLPGYKAYGKAVNFPGTQNPNNPNLRAAVGTKYTTPCTLQAKYIEEAPGGQWHHSLWGMVISTEIYIPGS